MDLRRSTTLTAAALFSAALFAGAVATPASAATRARPQTAPRQFIGTASATGPTLDYAEALAFDTLNNSDLYTCWEPYTLYWSYQYPDGSWIAQIQAHCITTP